MDDMVIPRQDYLVPNYLEQPMPYVVNASPGYVMPVPEPAFIQSAPTLAPEPEPVAMPEPMVEPEIPYDSGYNQLFINMAIQQVIPSFEPPEHGARNAWRDKRDD